MQVLKDLLLSIALASTASLAILALSFMVYEATGPQKSPIPGVGTVISLDGEVLG